MQKYGADGVRTGLLLSAAAGNDLLFDEELCAQGRNFSSKIWNAFRLIDGWEVSETIAQPESSKTAIKWYTAKFQKALVEIEKSFEQYRISEALMTIYKLIYDDFSSWFLEMIKPAYQQPVDSHTLKAAIKCLEDNLKILHPFMPFLTEEIWQHIETRSPEEALIIATHPAIVPFDEKIIADFEFASEIISGIRKIRKEKNISFKEIIALSVLQNESESTVFNAVITKLGNTSEITTVTEAVEGALSFRVKSNEYFIPIAGSIDVVAEKAKLEEELKYTEGFLKSVQKKLSNERFVNNAPEQVITNERKKEADALAKIETLQASIKTL
jgi:valyl-tRNA synthetase